jgi:hypothetical protein
VGVSGGRPPSHECALRRDKVELKSETAVRAQGDVSLDVWGKEENLVSCYLQWRS